MKFDIEQHFENTKPPQSEMAEEACDRKPPWSVENDAKACDAKKWKNKPGEDGASSSNGVKSSTDDENNTNGFNNHSENCVQNNCTTHISNGVSDSSEERSKSPREKLPETKQYSNEQQTDLNASNVPSPEEETKQVEQSSVVLADVEQSSKALETPNNNTENSSAAAVLDDSAAEEKNSSLEESVNQELNTSSESEKQEEQSSSKSKPIKESQTTPITPTRSCSIEMDSDEIERYLTTKRLGRPRKYGVAPKPVVKSPPSRKRKKKEIVSPRSTVVTRTGIKTMDPSDLVLPDPPKRVCYELMRLKLDPPPVKPEPEKSSPTKSTPEKAKVGRGRKLGFTLKDKIKEEPASPESTPAPVLKKRMGRPRKSFSPEPTEKPKKKFGHPMTFTNLLKKLQKIEMRNKKFGKANKIKLLKKQRSESPQKSSPTKNDSSPEGKRKPGRPPGSKNIPKPEKELKRKILKAKKESLKNREPNLDITTDSETTHSSDIVLKDCEIKLDSPLMALLEGDTCQLCKKVFTTKNKYYMRRHLASVHGMEPFCKRCSSIFESKQMLSDHIKTCDAKHNNQNKRMFAKLKHMRRKRTHKQIVEDLSPDDSCLCPYCDRIIAYRQNLKRHISAYHRDRDIEISNVVYTCPFCHKIVANKYNLQRHMTVLHRDEAFCKYCWELFNTFKELNVHIVKCKEIEGKRSKLVCPWESKSLDFNMLKFETQTPNENEEPKKEIKEIIKPISAEIFDETIQDCETLQDTLFGNEDQPMEIDCDNSEFFTPEDENNECSNVSFVISEVVEIFTTTDENSSSEVVVAACDNVINISPDSHAVAINNNSSSSKVINSEKCENTWDSENSNIDNSNNIDLHSLPVLTLRNPTLEDFHHETGSQEEDGKVYRVL